MTKRHLIRQYFAAICVVLATSGAARAENLIQEKFATNEPVPDNGAAVPLTAVCRDATPCALPPAEVRARVAAALLSLGIGTNCGQRACGIRLAASR